jgi:preprotein translocase subunit SecA
VGQLFGMFAETPVTPRDENGRARPPTAAEIASIEKLVELETLEREVYGLWGVKLDVATAREKKPAEVYAALEELVARGLSEQRERVLDLIDRVVSAMVEESCPRNRPPEDWDWTGIHDGFKEHIKRPLAKDVDELGELERLVRTVFERGEQAYKEKEKEVGVEHLLRLFRHFYLEEIDREWVDHLTNMEHLRDGIGLRGYGQRDPKNEYKKEGYNLFLNMMANVSSNVLAKTFEFRPQRTEDIAAMEAEAEARHQHELEAAIARHPGEDDDGAVDPAAALARMRESAQSVPQRAQPTSAAPKIGRNDLCPCGSGKKFKKCHGAALEDEEDQPTV